METGKSHKGAAVKAALLILFIIITIVAAPFTPIKEFIFTFVVGTVKEVWSSGHWEGLIS
jgi:hypothetical protein